MTKNHEYDLTDCLLIARQAVGLGRQVLLDHFGHLQKIENKFKAGLVTEADRESERIITEYLLKHYPNIPILGEESFFNENLKLAKSMEGQTCWILDPLDGTTNYVHQFSVFCISLGLMVNGEMVLGVIDAPMLNQIFYAIKGRGAFLNDRPIHVSKRKKLKDSLLATGFFAADADLLTEQLEFFSKLIYCTRGIRRAGAAAYDLCMVAMGVFDGFWEKNLYPWDIAAGSLFVQEAGGIVTRCDGSEFSVVGKEILASNTHLHKHIIGKFNEK